VPRQAVAPQDITNRLIGNLVPQIGQRSRDPVIAPIPVLAGQANDQLLDLTLDPRSARTSTVLRRNGGLIADLNRTWIGKHANANIPAGARPSAERSQIRVERFRAPR